MSAVDVRIGETLETEPGDSHDEPNGLAETGEAEPPILFGRMPHAMASLILRHIKEEPVPAAYDAAQVELLDQVATRLSDVHKHALHDSPHVIVGPRALRNIVDLHYTRVSRNDIPGVEGDVPVLFDAFEAYDLELFDPKEEENKEDKELDWSTAA